MLNKMLKWRKKNSKGFSLVELIIVIAIMAILVGILAPQFIQYVNRSRVSTDIKNYQEVISAIQVYCADTESNAPTDDKEAVFALNKGKAATVTGDNTAAVTKAITDAGMSLAGIVGKSNDYDGSTKASLTIKFTAKGPEFTYSGALSKAMAGTT